MAYRIFVDENIDPNAVDLLRDRGHDAVHVSEALGKGTDDTRILEYAREEGLILLTNVTDVLKPDHREEITVLYCPANTMRGDEIVALIDEFESIIPNQSDLPEISWITEDSLS